MSSQNFAICVLLLLVSCAPPDHEQWEKLLDTNLSKWNTYISFQHTKTYNGQPPRNAAGELIEPLGMNNDPKQVFSVREKDGELILSVSGEMYGCLFTKKEYKNYHLRLKVKWGDKKWPPREALLKDTGILYHSVGPLGAEYWRTWMLSQEFQIMQGHMGDYWCEATSAIDIKAFIPEYTMNPVADTSQQFISLGAGEDIQGFCLRSGNYEKPEGEWNTLDLFTFEDKSIHMVNGQVVMVLRNSRYVKGDETIPLTSGKIQLQSEAAEVFYKDIEISSLESLPERFQIYYN